MNYRQVYKDNKTMMYKINFKKNLMNITAKVNHENELIVNAPYNLDVSIIDEFIVTHFDKFYDFIQSREANAMIDLKQNILYLHGIKYQLITNIINPNQKQKYEIINNNIHLFLKNEDNKQKMVEKILFDIGHSYIVKMAVKIAKKLNFQVNTFDTKWYKSKWGQCEPRKREINFAIQLIMFNDEIIEYVIIHELCHLIHPDHSSNFWSEVEKYYPKYKWAREKLKFQV